MVRAMMSIRRASLLAPDELHALLSAGEGERLAHMPASAPPRALAETLAALANANGGWLLLGARAAGARSRKPTLPAEPSELADLLLRATLLCDPPLILPAPQPLAVEEVAELRGNGAALLGKAAHGPALLVQVPPGLPNVYNVQGIYSTRTGAHNRPLTTPELRALLLERGEGAYEAQVVDGATLADLDPQRIDRYLERLMLLPVDDPTETLLARGCLARQPGTDRELLRPTVAGLLLFGREPQQHLRSAEILCVRYPGATMADEFVRQAIGGPLTDQIRQAEAFVAGNITRSARLDGLARSDQPALPMSVVREAIVNAVAHRDYSVRGEGIRLLLFSDRLEVYSPGRLPGHVTLENIKDERFSRNEALVSLLSDLGFIERLGYGVDRMYAALHEAGLPEPAFAETAAGFRVTLFSAAHAAAQAASQVAAQVTRPAQAARSAQPAPAPAPTEAPLNDRQLRALDRVRESGRITNGDLQEMAPDVSAETVRRDLADLVARNLLLRIGTKRATYYILK
jgi:ATP-dependent DNA helicase RecG